MTEAGKMLDELLPLPGVPQDMGERDYRLYIKLAELFVPMREAVESAVPEELDTAQRKLHGIAAAIAVELSGGGVVDRASLLDKINEVRDQLIAAGSK
jgi:hypothetical protein